MQVSALAVLAAVIVLPTGALADDPRPDWIGDAQLSMLTKVGIDPSGDLEVKGNYHWRWRAKHKLAFGTYSCPAGSAVEVSRSITLVVAAETAPCSDLTGGHFGFLKILPDGSAEPLAR